MVNRHDLAYDLIPFLINDVKNNKLHFSALYDDLFFKHIFSDEQAAFETDHFKIEYEILSNNSVIVKYTFPEPTTSPEAKYGIVYINKENDNIDYYTLELTLNIETGLCDQYMVGSMSSSGTHINYGLYNLNIDMETFASFIKSKFIL